MKKQFLLLALAAICSLSVWAQTERPFVSNLTGTPSASVQSLSASLSWTYNVPFSLSGAYSSFANSGSCTPSYANGILTLAYNSSGKNSYQAIQIDNRGSNVSSFSFEAKSDNVSNKPVIVVHSWGGADNVVADKVDIEADWKEFVVVPQYAYSAGANYAKGSAISGSFGTSVGCMSFLPIAESSVSGGKTYIRNAYFQLSSRAGVTSTVKIVRKNGSEPTSDSDGIVLSFNGNETTFTDNQDLLEGQTYYYRVFGTYNGVAYQSNAISVTMPGTPKIDPQLSFGLATKSLVKDATFDKPVSFVSGFDKTKVAYTSSNTGVATIDANGVVTAKAVGTTVISAHSDAYGDYAVGNASYTLTVIELPIVSNLQIVNPENNIVPLSFEIPGIVDLNKGENPKYPQVGNATWQQSDDMVNVSYNTVQGYQEGGVAFYIPSVTKLEYITFDYANLTGGAQLWIGAIESNGSAYSQHNLYFSEASGTNQKCIPDKKYWGQDPDAPILSKTFVQIGIFANAGASACTGSFSVRNVRYHVKDAVDVDHVVITRRLSTESEGDAVELYSGTKSAFTDNTITVAGTYIYTVYCEDKDGNRSAGATVNYVYAPATAYSVIYTIGDDVTGEVPTETDHIANAIFKVKAGTNLKRQGYTFAGWNDGTKTYQVGDDYTMPENNVVFTAQWEEKTVSPVTDFTATGIYKDVTLTWQFPATSKRLPVDLSNARVKYVNQSTLTITKAETNLAKCSYNINTGWGYIGFDFPLGKTVSNFESVSFDYLNDGKNVGGRVILNLYAAKGDSRWYDGGSDDLTNDEWTTLSTTPNQVLRSASETYSHAIDAVGLEINKENIGNGTASVKNVILTLSEGEWIEGMKLLRKAGSAPTGPTDAEATEISLEGLALTYTDVLPITQTEVTYHYALYTYDDEGNYSTAATASYTFVPQQEYTVTYAAGGAQGDVPVDETPKVEGFKFNLPAPGGLLKPYCQFNGWKSSDDDKVYAAGDEYTMPAKNVTFTAQWGAEEQGLRIPENTVRLDWSNKSATTATSETFGGEQCFVLGGQHSAEWNVYIAPCEYTIEYNCGTINYGYNLVIEIIDPVTNEVVVTYKEENTPATFNTLYTKSFSWDLSSVVVGKKYVVRAKDNWNDATSHLRLGHIDFIPTITIDQSKDDNLIFNGKANVTLIRPLTADMTNSICLPFALDRDQINTAFGEGAEVWTLTSSTLSANNMTLEIEFEQVEEMSAGVPYLIQPGADYNREENPVFEEIEMSTTLDPVEHANLDFIGVVQKSYIEVGYKDHLFVGADNMLYYPQGSDYLNGMRSYFKIKYHPEVEVPANTQARMIFGRTTPTGWKSLRANETPLKTIKNGRLLIIRNGVTKDIFGNTVK